MYVRAMLCNCRRRLEAENEDALRALVREHLMAEHAAMRPTEEQVTEIVSVRAYNLEHVNLPVGADSTVEDFGSEPY